MEFDLKDNDDYYKGSKKRVQSTEVSLNKKLFDQMIASSNASKKYFNIKVK
ncbi:MAG: hypothetical protein JEZ08_11885 [Clostridiales bacterium]|nr:hypothetical protein [Clostridiales bacterium]